MDDRPFGSDANGFVPLVVFERLGGRVESARLYRRLSDVCLVRMVLDLWDAVVQDEAAAGKPVRGGGIAERGFLIHLAALLDESRNRAVTVLHAAITIRALPACWAAFQEARFGLAAVEAIVRHTGSLCGEAREAYDLAAARLAAETVPQRLDVVLSRLHDSLDHEAGTMDGANAHRQRGVRARPGMTGMAELILRGPEFDIAAVYESAHRLAVAAHGKAGEDRTIQQLMYDIVLDLVLGGITSPPPAPAPSPASVGGGDAPADVDGIAGADDSAGDDEPASVSATTAESPPGAESGSPSGAAPGGVVPSNITLCPDGSFTPSSPFERLGDPRVPHRKVIHAEILVTVPAATACGAADAPGRLAGWGSLPAAEVRRVVASSRYWTRVETDPVDDAILAFDSDKRAIPAALRRLIWARSETCDEPGCPTPAHRCDIDHVIRVQYQGRTMQINLSALCRPGHQTKDDGYLDVERTPEGLRWRTRWGKTIHTPNQTPIRARPTTPTTPPEPDTDDPAPFDTAA